MKLVSCTICNNECSPLAKTCPKCGHPFTQQEPFPSLAIAERKPRSYSRYIGISVGALFALAGGLVVVFVLFSDQIITLVSKSPQEVFLNKQPSVKTVTNPTPKPSESGTLDIIAGIDYKMGGVQPITSENFYLLDDDLAVILKASGMKANPDTGYLGTFGMNVKYFADRPDHKKAVKAISQHTKYEAVTDLQGKAKFLNVHPGTYHIFGYSTTRGGFAVWNYEISVRSGSNSQVIDGKNAALAF